MVKKRTRSELTQDQIDAFANAADEYQKPAKPEKKEPEPEPEPEKEKVARTTISLPASMLEALEDLAISNKRAGLPNKNVSAIIRASLEKSMK